VIDGDQEFSMFRVQVMHYKSMKHGQYFMPDDRRCDFRVRYDM